MNATARFLSAAIATALLALPAPQSAQAASTALQRCSNADGSEIFTDKSCAAFGAKTAPIPAPMMMRLARTFSERNDPETGGIDAIPVSVARRSPAGGCARTPQQLEMDLRASLALGDVNRIAESYHWAGLTHADGQRTLDRLETMAASPLRDIHYFDAQIASATYGGDLYADASGSMATPTGNAGTLQLQLGRSSVHVLDLSVERYSGCYFVRF